MKRGGPLKRKTPLRAKPKTLSPRMQTRLRKAIESLAPAVVEYYRDGEDPRRDVPHSLVIEDRTDYAKLSESLRKSVGFSTLKPKRPKTTKARKAANGMPCTFNVAGVCRDDGSVLCHLPFVADGGGGVGRKCSDLIAAHGCNACHDWIDMRVSVRIVRAPNYQRDRNFYAARALGRMRLLDATKGTK